MDQGWTLKPLQGLGPLSFETPEAEVSAVAPFLGERRAIRDLGRGFGIFEISQAEIDEMIEFLGEDGAKETMAAMLAQDQALSGKTLSLFATGVQLTFAAATLTAILAPPKARKLHFEGNLFFGEDPLPTLRALSVANGQPPLVNGADVVFDQIGVVCFGFTEPQGDEFQIVPAPQADLDSSEHTVSWGQTLDRTPDVLAPYQRYAL